jgi:hypothetical protein
MGEEPQDSDASSPQDHNKRAHKALTGRMRSCFLLFVFARVRKCQLHFIPDNPKHLIASYQLLPVISFRLGRVS